jgi:xylan 1,4-beta-xylosidase
MMSFQCLLSSLVVVVVGLGVVKGFELPDCVNGPLAINTVCDPKAAPSDRAAALVRAMDISEKLVNLVE